MADMRLIPARAGNTVPFGCRVLGGSAHPRSRGEHIYPVADEVAYAGSSPLARGTLRARWSSCLVVRLIPARAGNTYRQ